MFELTKYSDGTSGGLWPSGCIVYFAVVILINIRVLDQHKSYNLRVVVIILLSILLYIPSYYILQLRAFGTE